MRASAAAEKRKIPMRRCVGCMESKPKIELVRIAGYEGQVAIDSTGRAKGRGVYLCPNQSCMEKAKKKRALQRGLEVDLTPEQIHELFEELKAYEKQNP